MPDYFDTPRERLVLPFLSSFYASFAQPVGWLAFRLIIGGLFMVEGWHKIQQPMAQSGFVEMIGFAPGWFFLAVACLREFLRRTVDRAWFADPASGLGKCLGIADHLLVSCHPSLWRCVPHGRGNCVSERKQGLVDTHRSNAAIDRRRGGLPCRADRGSTQGGMELAVLVGGRGLDRGLRRRGLFHRQDVAAQGVLIRHSGFDQRQRVSTAPGA